MPRLTIGKISRLVSTSGDVVDLLGQTTDAAFIATLEQAIRDPAARAKVRSAIIEMDIARIAVSECDVGT